MPGLINARPTTEALLGSGFNSQSSLFQRSLLQDGNLLVIDNQFVSTLATAGIIGLLALVGLVFAAFNGRGPSEIAILLAAVSFFFIFDALRWLGPAVFIIVLFFQRSIERRASADTPQFGGAN